MRTTLAMLLLLGGTLPLHAESPPVEKLPPGTKVMALDVTPKSVALTGAYAYSQLVVTAKLDSGDIADVTRLATWAAPASVKVNAAGQVRPLADSTGEVTATLGGQSVRVPVTVAGLKATPSRRRS